MTLFLIPISHDSFLQKTWQRLRSTGLFHDAIPQQYARIGHPMHVKVCFVWGMTKVQEIALIARLITIMRCAPGKRIDYNLIEHLIAGRV